MSEGLDRLIAGAWNRGDLDAHAALRALDDRRQSAREAALDVVPPGYYLPSGVLDGAIEVATQVKITDDIIEAAQNAFPLLRSVDEGRKMIAAAFRAAGFEVVE